MGTFNGGVSRASRRPAKVNSKSGKQSVPKTQPEDFDRDFLRLVLNISGSYSTSIPDVWELEGYEFVTICSIMIEDMAKANGETTGPAMSIDAVQAFGKLLEQVNGR